MTDEEIQLKAQRSLQEYDDAVENLDPKFTELGQKAVAALDELIKNWSDKDYRQKARPLDKSGESDAQLREYAERLIKWAEDEKMKVLANLSKTSTK
jgi:hypothetical protein